MWRATRRRVWPRNVFDPGRDRTGAVVVHDAAVDAAGGHDAAGGRREEDLVGVAGLVRGDAADLARDAEFVAQLEHAAAGDALQHAGVGRDDGAVDHHEDIVAGALRDVAVGVEQEAELGMPVERLELAAGEVGPVEVLRGRVDGVGRDAAGLRDGEMGAALLRFGAHDPDPGDGEGGDVVARIGGMVRLARRWTAAQAIHGDIGAAELGQGDAAVEDGADVVVGLRGREAELAHGGAEAGDVVVETEEIALPDADDVVGDVRAAVAPVGDRDRGLADRHVTAVDVGGAVGVGVVDLRRRHWGRSAGWLGCRAGVRRGG